MNGLKYQHAKERIRYIHYVEALEYVLMYVNNAMLIDYCATECFFIHDFELACEIESN